MRRESSEGSVLDEVIVELLTDEESVALTLIELGVCAWKLVGITAEVVSSVVDLFLVPLKSFVLCGPVLVVAGPGD